ncbi:MAG: threonine synthase [Chitinophagaceae bacterium]
MELSSTTLSPAPTIVCSNCNRVYAAEHIPTYATCCNQPLILKYAGPGGLTKEVLLHREKTMWRYWEMLPLRDERNKVSLGEGMTPILRLSNLEREYGYQQLLIKDESFNPTGSFKARGLSVAISKAKELGIQQCIIPTAGNAGGAAAAYCAKAGIKCTVVMPRHTPAVFKTECELYGADLLLVDGLINDCAKRVEQLKEKSYYFDLSTLKEPYRLEGKKTMGYEIAEQSAWQLPDYIFYPAGGGTGLIGIWKAFQEMLQLEWITGPLPKMIAVQAQNCSPLLHYQQDPINWKDTFVPHTTIANGLAVPYPFGMKMMQQVLQHSGGSVISISEKEIVSGVREIARKEGILVAPEGAALWTAVRHLEKQGIVSIQNSILLLNTGSGYKYLENLV